jgi:hypothetical protein
MPNPYLTRRAVLVSGAALAVHSALGLPTGRMTPLPMARAHDMTEIINKYIAAELALPAPLVTDAMFLETLYRHALAQEQGVEVQHVVDQVGSLGIRETDVIAFGLIMGVEAFFDAEIPIEALDTMRTVGDLQALLLPQIAARAALEALYQRCPAVVEQAIQTFTNASFAAPPLHNLLQTLPGQGSHRVVDGNS